MIPSDRDGLVELMARGAVVHRFGDGADDHQCGEGGSTVAEWTLRASDMEAALTAIESAGCMVVPVVATEEMIRAGDTCDFPVVMDIYHRMLNASPYRSK